MLDLPAHGGDRLDDPSPLRGRLARPRCSSRSTGTAVSRRTGPIAMPGDAGSGPLRRRSTRPARRLDGVARRSRRTGASASVSRCSTASWACGPEARTSTSWPCRAASVATRLRLPAGTGPAPVVRLRSWTDASRPRTSLTSRAAGRACSPCGFSTVKTPTTSSRRPTRVRVRRRARPARTGARPCPCSAPRASAATSARLAPPAAATAATKALDDRRRRERHPVADGGSSSRSSASSALSTALPRSIRTTTPAGPSARSMASLMRDRVGAERRLVEPGGHLDPHRAAVQHLRRQRDRGPRQRAAVGDDDQADAGRSGRRSPGASVMSLRSARRHVSSAQDGSERRSVAASSSRATVVAPGSWWPTLRSPR